MLFIPETIPTMVRFLLADDIFSKATECQEWKIIIIFFNFFFKFNLIDDQ